MTQVSTALWTLRSWGWSLRRSDTWCGWPRPTWTPPSCSGKGRLVWCCGADLPFEPSRRSDFYRCGSRAASDDVKSMCGFVCDCISSLLHASPSKVRSTCIRLFCLCVRSYDFLLHRGSMWVNFVHYTSLCDNLQLMRRFHKWYKIHNFPSVYSKIDSANPVQRSRFYVFIKLYHWRLQCWQKGNHGTIRPPANLHPSHAGSGVRWRSGSINSRFTVHPVRGSLSLDRIPLLGMWPGEDTGSGLNGDDGWIDTSRSVQLPSLGLCASITVCHCCGAWLPPAGTPFALQTQDIIFQVFFLKKKKTQHNAVNASYTKS